MDQRLFDAARIGDVVALHALLNEDPLMLDKICLVEYAETPLHVAALAGKIEFAKEIIRLMPCLTMELNKDGFAPMHLASARGHMEMVMELLKHDNDYSLCFQKDKSGQIPLHHAVARGRILVIEKLISHCFGSLQEVTALGETVLHLAVKNFQFEALKVLLRRLKGLEWFQTALSTKDNKDEGKTIVELAQATKQIQVLELLREEHHVSIAENDQITGIQSTMSPRNETREFAQAANTQNDEQHEWREVTEPSKIQQHNLILVAAVVILTETYQAGLSPPPSIWTEYSSLYQSIWLACFMVLNTAGFLSSALLILWVTRSYKHKTVSLLGISVIILMLNYALLACTMYPHLALLWGCPPFVIAALYCFHPLARIIVRVLERMKEAWRQSRFSIQDILPTRS